MSNNLVVFDLDYTLISVDCSTLWCKYMYDKGIVDSSFLKKEEELMMEYDIGKMSVYEYISFSTKPLLSMSCDDVSLLVKNFIEKDIADKIYPQAKNLIEKCKQNNEDILIISASASYLVKEVAYILGIDKVLSINVEIKDNRYTQNIVGIPTFREGKVTNLERYLSDRNYDNIIFYTDSINDLPLLRRVNKGYVVNPLPNFRELAIKEGYEILYWEL